MKSETLSGGVSDLDTVILNPEDSQHVKATYVHIWNTTQRPGDILTIVRTLLARLTAEQGE